MTKDFCFEDRYERDDFQLEVLWTVDLIVGGPPMRPILRNREGGNLPSLIHRRGANFSGIATGLFIRPPFAD